MSSCICEKERNGYYKWKCVNLKWKEHKTSDLTTKSDSVLFNQIDKDGGGGAEGSQCNKTSIS